MLEKIDSATEQMKSFLHDEKLFDNGAKEWVHGDQVWEDLGLLDSSVRVAAGLQSQAVDLPPALADQAGDQAGLPADLANAPGLADQAGDAPGPPGELPDAPPGR